MELPSFQDCMFPLLRLAIGGQQHTLQEVTDAIAEHFQLSQEMRNQRRESGVNILYNRVAWARTYLKQANLLTYPVRGSLQITDEGKQVVESGLQNIDIKYLKRIPAYVEFQKGKKELSESGPNPDILEELLQEFAEAADKWFAKCSFVTEFNQFIQDFFRPEKLQIAEWPDFQTLANKLHSFNSVALAKGNAFGRQNYNIEKYRESFHFLAHGPGSIEDRMRAFMGDNKAYASKYLGNSVVSELIGQLFADRFVFMNRRDIEAAEFLGINQQYERGDDFPTRFTKFNTSLEPLIEAYRQIVGSRTGAPIGLEIDQFLSWLYENKMSDTPQPPPGEEQIWVFAPGPRAKFWDECRDGSIAVYGADLLGPLDAYSSKEEILQRLKEVYPKDTEPTNDALAAWEFSRVMKKGDLVIAKKGNRTIVGVGIVVGPYRHDSGRVEYPNVRDVEWTLTQEGDLTLPSDIGFATKTLTNITRYRDYVQKIKNVIWPPVIDVPDKQPEYSVEDCSNGTGLDTKKIERWIRAIERKGQAVIYGPPGTGKTHVARRLAKHLVAGSDGFVDLVQFHPAYAYEDFMQGIRPKASESGGLDYPMVPGRFLEFCKVAEQRKGCCVLILDEINRANLSRVFGELMFLLEYRDERIPLAGGGRFGIPENVRLIGTMNTADRSIALVDHALRRRFAFLELCPNYDVVESHHLDSGFSTTGLVEILKRVNQKIGNRHYMVGISFFLINDLEDQIEDIWRMEIEPYLDEYFDQPEKVDEFRWDKVKGTVVGT